MTAILCHQCENPPILTDFGMVDDNTIQLALFCPICEEQGAVQIQLREEEEEDYGYGQYL